MLHENNDSSFTNPLMLLLIQVTDMQTETIAHSDVQMCVTCQTFHFTDRILYKIESSNCFAVI